MAFCENCGNQVSDGAKYCSKCGLAITPSASTNKEQRKEVFEGEVHKCPNCGELIKSFTLVCPSCGYEIRGNQSSGSTRSFMNKLEQIEANRKPLSRKERSLIANIFGSDGQLNSIDEQKINLIKSFSIPNNKEDILEFMILGASNINYKLYGLGDKGVITASQREVSDAWLSKMEQAYDKARVLLKNNTDMQDINEIYVKANKKIKRKRMELPLLVCGPLALLVIGMVLALIFL